MLCSTSLRSRCRVSGQSLRSSLTKSQERSECISNGARSFGLRRRMHCRRCSSMPCSTVAESRRGHRARRRCGARIRSRGVLCSTGAFLDVIAMCPRCSTLDFAFGFWTLLFAFGLCRARCVLCSTTAGAASLKRVILIAAALLTCVLIAAADAADASPLVSEAAWQKCCRLAPTALLERCARRTPAVP